MVLGKDEAIEKAIAWFVEQGKGEKKITYRLRDWLFSRQRYWGEPIPIIHWEDGTMTALDESELPLTLPVTDNIKPSGTGESPLANIEEWINVVRSRNWDERSSRNKYDAAMGGKLLVLLALHRSG